MLKLIVPTLALVSILFVALINRSPVNDVLQSAEFPEANPSNRISVAELPTLRPGATLYHALSPRPFAIVAATDPTHEFSDGAIAPAILVEFKNGTQFWLRQKHVNRMFTDKPESNSNSSRVITKK